MPKQALAFKPMKVQVRPNSKAERNYHTDRGLPGSAMPMPKIIAPGIDPSPLHDLIFHGGKVTPNMHYKNFYLGGTTSWKEADIVSIDTALSAAMRDSKLNNVMKQYFPGAKISCDFHGSDILAVPKPKSFDEPDVQKLVKKLHANGDLAGFDLTNSIFNFVLPSGSVLKLDSDSSLGGLGGYHGSVHVKKGSVNTTLYYSIGVFSEFLANGNENGIVVFDSPWKNVVGTFYHELNEFRTDADVDDAIRANSNDFLGWMSRQGEEIGDQPISAAGGVLTRVFSEIKLTGKKTTVPVQFMYSNFVHGAEGPIAKPHQ
jgi:hypothetical protein